MDFIALTCPECGGALPRQALWRALPCPYCRVVVTRRDAVVARAPYRAAHLRSLAQGADGPRVLRIGGHSYRVLAPLGQGDHSEVLLAERCGALPARVTIKLAPTPDAGLAAEAATLLGLQELEGPGAAYFSRRLPQVMAIGRADAAGNAREALVLRHPSGFWGSLADVQRAHPQGIGDPRHAVWIWRRVLELLGYLHGAGWAHGDLRAAHWLLHPRDHGGLVIGWRMAQRGGDTARDLMQSAWTIRALLAGDGDTAPALPSRLPSPLADLLRAASEDAAFCARLGATGIDQALVDAARAAFGAPQFVPFDPRRA